MLRHCATLTPCAFAALVCCMSSAWAQEAPLRASFSEAAPAPVETARYSPQGGLDRAIETQTPVAPPPVASAQPRSLPEQSAAGVIDEVYAPTGIGLGGFDIFPSIEFRGGFQEVSGGGDAYGTAIGQLAAIGALGLFDIDLNAGAEVERDADGLGEIAFDAALAAEGEINRHLGLRGDLLIERNPQDGLSFNDDNTLSNLPDEMVYGVGAELALKGNRASLAPRLRTARHAFSGAGGADDLNYRRDEAGLRASYEFSPLLSVFTDGEAARSRFDDEVGSDGVARGSQTRALSLGAAYTPGSWLEAEVSLGVEEAEFEDGSHLSGARGEASLLYRATALTDLVLRGRHGIADDIIAAGGVRETEVSLSMVHRFRAYLQFDAAIAYLREDAEGGEDAARLDAEAELGYALRRGVQLTAGGGLSRLTEGANAGDTDWQVYMGVKLAR